MKLSLHASRYTLHASRYTPVQQINCSTVQLLHFLLGPLHLSRALYKSTLFMQNKPNFPDAQMNVKSFHTLDYENKSNWKLRKNKANTKPIRANLLDAQMKLSSVLTKYYENEHLHRRGKNKPKTNPISEKPK